MQGSETDIDESQIPGTVLLVDVEHTAEALHSQSKDNIILIPTPSNDINDPLNWSTWRKRKHLICLIACVFDLYQIYLLDCQLWS